MESSALAAEPTATEVEGPGEELNALVEVLRDDAAREALIDKLLNLSDAGDDAKPSEATAPGIAQRIAGYTRDAAESLTTLVYGTVSWLEDLQRSLRTTGGFRFQDLVDIAVRLLIVIGTVIGAYIFLGLAARPIHAALSRRAEQRGAIQRAALLLLSLLLDALRVLLAWTAGYGVALYALGEAGRMDIRQSLFLNAFLVVQSILVVLRSVWLPRVESARFVPAGDLTSAYWYFWLARIVSVLGYGLLFLAPLAALNLPASTGRAVQVIVGLVALIMTVLLILQNRKSVAEALEARAKAVEGGTVGRMYGLLSRTWHVLALTYVIGLFVIWSTRPEGALSFMLKATAQSIAAVLLGLFIVGLISRGIRRGLRVPDELKRRLPLLEPRINAFVPAMLQAIRLVVVLAVILFVLHAWSVFDLVGWLASTAGQTLISRGLSVAIVLLVAALLWLGLSSWVEYRLNPDVGRAPSPRLRTLLSLFRNAATVALAIVTLMLVLSEMGLNIAPLLAGAGVIGLAIGFGAQKLVQDIITGVFIQLENAFNEGDVITVAGHTGVVEKLTVRSVSLRDLHGVYHIVPFSSVDSVSNFMMGFSYHVAEIGVAYRESVDEAKSLMHRAFDELREKREFTDDILGPLEWHGLTQFGDSAVVLRARIKARPGKQWAMGRAYNEIIKRLFDEAGIEIPYPHMTLYFGQDKDGTAPPLKAEIDGMRMHHDASTVDSETGRELRPSSA